jgi:hypothetical protein
MHPHNRIAGAVTRLDLIEREGGIAPGKMHGGNGIGAPRPAARITPEPTMDVSSFERRPRAHVEPLDASEVVSGNLHRRIFSSFDIAGEAVEDAFRHVPPTARRARKRLTPRPQLANAISSPSP